jgi:hypothetical protein
LRISIAAKRFASLWDSPPEAVTMPIPESLDAIFTNIFREIPALSSTTWLGRSIIAANYIYNAAPKDGTVIGNISGQIILEQLFANPAVQYDLGTVRTWACRSVKPISCS